METYDVHAQADPRGGWSLLLDGVGVSHVYSLGQATEEMSSAVIEMAGKNLDDFTVTITVHQD